MPLLVECCIGSAGLSGLKPNGVVCGNRYDILGLNFRSISGRTFDLGYPEITKYSLHCVVILHRLKIIVFGSLCPTCIDDILNDLVSVASSYRAPLCCVVRQPRLAAIRSTTTATPTSTPVHPSKLLNPRSARPAPTVVTPLFAACRVSVYGYRLFACCRVRVKSDTICPFMCFGCGIPNLSCGQCKSSLPSQRKRHEVRSENTLHRPSKCHVAEALGP